MFCEAPFCDLPIASFYYELSNGEIFYFDAEVQQVKDLIASISSSKLFIINIYPVHSLVADISDSKPFVANINQTHEEIAVR